MRTYGQFCPVARTSGALDADDRAHLLNGCRSFTQLRDGAPGIPPSVMAGP